MSYPRPFALARACGLEKEAKLRWGFVDMQLSLHVVLWGVRLILLILLLLLLLLLSMCMRATRLSPCTII
jgi:hypothetical protein